MAAHHCHALDCRMPCPPAMLMCKPCWAHVTPPTQKEVYRTVRLRGSYIDASWAPWWRAQAKAIAECYLSKVALSTLSEAEKTEAQVWVARYLAREEKVARRFENETEAADDEG